MPAELHISSLLVHARPERLAAIGDAIRLARRRRGPLATANGKIVVTLETADERQVVERVDAIRAMPGVLTVALVFHRIDTAAA